MSMSRKMALSASAAAAALACAGSALAQVPSNWSGPYLGATLGYGASHFNNVYHVYELTTGTTGADNVSLTGLVGGLQAGYRAEMGSNVVLGARAGALWTGVRGSGTAISCPAVACFLNNSTTQNDQVTSAQTLQLDVGYAMGEWLRHRGRRPGSIQGLWFGQQRLWVHQIFLHQVRWRLAGGRRRGASD